MELKILCLYPNIMDLYGDNGNIEIIKYRATQREIKVFIDTYTIYDKEPNFEQYDIVFLGGGSDKEQEIITKDLIQYREKIKNSIDNGVFYLLICSGFQIFGKNYIDVNNKNIKCLNIFPYYTKKTTEQTEYCIGDVVIETQLNDNIIKIVGFENHSGQTYDIKNSFGKVLYGNGNYYKSEIEGFMLTNVIGTYLHGPLLSKNPKLTDYIIEYCLNRKYKNNIKLKDLNDTFENKAKKEILDRLLTMSTI